MARQVTERPLTEHIATLTRVVSQLSVSTRLSKASQRALIRKIGEVIDLLRKELV